MTSLSIILLYMLHNPDTYDDLKEAVSWALVMMCRVYEVWKVDAETVVIMGEFFDFIWNEE